MEVPEDPEDASLPPPPVTLEASTGFIVAAGWIEGRLSTARVVGGTLEISHARFDIESGTSRAASLPLPATGMRFVPGPRLDPFARWWDEVNPVEQWLAPSPVLRDSDDRLYSIAFRHDAVSVVPVAEDVRVLSSFEERRTVLFAGRVLPERSLRRFPSPAAEHDRAPFCVFSLERRYAGRPGLRRPLGASATSTFLGSPVLHGPDDAVEVAVEVEPRRFVVHRTAGTSAVTLAADEIAVGTLLGGMLTVDATRTRLTLALAEERVALVDSTDPIEHVAVRAGDPLIAYTTRSNELVFVGLTGDIGPPRLASAAAPPA